MKILCAKAWMLYICLVSFCKLFAMIWLLYEIWLSRFCFQNLCSYSIMTWAHFKANCGAFVLNSYQILFHRCPVFLSLLLFHAILYYAYQASLFLSILSHCSSHLWSLYYDFLSLLFVGLRVVPLWQRSQESSVLLTTSILIARDL